MARRMAGHFSCARRLGCGLFRPARTAALAPNLRIEGAALPLLGGIAALAADSRVKIGAVLFFDRAAALLADLGVVVLAVFAADRLAAAFGLWGSRSRAPLLSGH